MDLVTLKTSGDRLADVSLAKVGGKGLFVKEIEEALLEGRADLAVHSAKDLPARIAPGLVLAAFPERADPRDALVARAPRCAASSAAGGRARRHGQRAARDAAPRAAARPRDRAAARQRDDAARAARGGPLRRGGARLRGPRSARASADRIDERIAPELLLPAVGQGVLAIEARADDALAARARVDRRSPGGARDPRGARLPRAPRGRLQRAARGVRARSSGDGTLLAARARRERRRRARSRARRRAAPMRRARRRRASRSSVLAPRRRRDPRRAARGGRVVSGRVVLVGAGPGDPDLITLRGAERAARAPTSWSTTRSSRASCSTWRPRTPSASTSASAVTRP